MDKLGSQIISGPIGMIIGTILLMSVFGFATATINGWFLSSVPAGVTNFERYDRVVKYDASKSTDDTWAAATALESSGFSASGAVATAAALDNGLPNTTTVYKIVQEGERCKIGVITGAVVATTPPDRTLPTETYITPAGTQVRTSATTVDGHASTANTADVFIAGCTYEDSSPVLDGPMGAVISIVLQAIGLAGPVVLLAIVGGFGSSVMQNVPAHPILKIIVMVILLLLVGYLVNVVLPFLSNAHAAIDPMRFLMYDSGIGRLSIVIGDFFGVVLVAGLLSVAWTLWSSMRSTGNVLGGQKM